MKQKLISDTANKFVIDIMNDDELKNIFALVIVVITMK